MRDEGRFRAHLMPEDLPRGENDEDLFVEGLVDRNRGGYRPEEVEQLLRQAIAYGRDQEREREVKRQRECARWLNGEQ